MVHISISYYLTRVIVNSFFISVVFKVVSSQVIEIDDSFIEKRLDRAWLVEFYAPWCGHCRKLEPTYHQVHLELRNSQIAVAKVDATRYPRLASEYEVRGYPTIKFIQGSRVFTHNGERTKENIVEFAKRAYGPQVRPLSNAGKLTDARNEHGTSGAFFVYIGPQDDQTNLYIAYKSVAEKFAVLSYFYAGENIILPSDIQAKNYPTVLVVKDRTHYEFEVVEADDNVTEVLSKWVNTERFHAMPTVVGVGLNEMSEIGKLLVILVGDDKDKSNIHQIRFKELGASLATGFRDTHSKQFQFVWLSDPETANSIMMTTVPVPSLFVLDPKTQNYYVPDGTDFEAMTADDILAFINAVVDGKYPAYGGTGIGQRFKRLFYEIWSTIYGIYHESPWLALMVFGIPTFVISIICYTLCCLEPADDDTTLDPDEDDDEEDKEGEMDGRLPNQEPAWDNHAKKE